MIHIIGAGLAGLSAAYHLKGLPYRLHEKESEVGGLCRSYTKDGFTFDMTGHLLHFRQPEIKALVEVLLAGRLTRHGRRSYLYSHESYTEYPFQVNTHGLPPEVVRDCLLGFIATLTAKQDAATGELSLQQWILANLGEGIAKHFMVPFNEKLWQVRLDELTADWVSWLVPKPDIKDVVNGALGSRVYSRCGWPLARTHSLLGSSWCHSSDPLVPSISIHRSFSRPCEICEAVTVHSAPLAKRMTAVP